MDENWTTGARCNGAGHVPGDTSAECYEADGGCDGVGVVRAEIEAGP